MTLKSKCCEKYKKKPKTCKRCPLTASLSKKGRKRLIRKFKKLRAKGADGQAVDAHCAA